MKTTKQTLMGILAIIGYSLIYTIGGGLLLGILGGISGVLHPPQLPSNFPQIHFTFSDGFRASAPLGCFLGAILGTLGAMAISLKYESAARLIVGAFGGYCLLSYLGEYSGKSFSGAALLISAILFAVLMQIAGSALQKKSGKEAETTNQG